jgi:hypothetical protein
VKKIKLAEYEFDLDDGQVVHARRHGEFWLAGYKLRHTHAVVAMLERIADLEGDDAEGDVTVGAPAAERWARVEVMGNREHVGRISEERLAGASYLRVEVLRADGSFDTVLYGRSAIFSVAPRTEAEARREAVPVEWCACAAFRPSGALPTACEQCGHDLPEHDAEATKRKSEDDHGPDSF